MHAKIKAHSTRINDNKLNGLLILQLLVIFYPAGLLGQQGTGGDGDVAQTRGGTREKIHWVNHSPGQPPLPNMSEYLSNKGIPCWSWWNLGLWPESTSQGWGNLFRIN